MADRQNPPAGAPKPPDDKPVMLRRSDAQRTEKAVQWSERYYRNREPHTARGPRGGVTPAYVAVASGSISARSGSTAGTGTATLQVFNTSTRAISSESLSVTAYNPLNKTIASGAYLVLVWGPGGWWVVAVGDCANLS